MLTLYVEVVTLSSATQTTDTKLDPTDNEMSDDTFPDITNSSLTLTVDLSDVTVGETVMDVTAFPTVTV